MKLEVISVPDIVKSVISDLAAEARKKKIEIVFNSVSSESGSSKTGKTVGSQWLFTLMVYNLLRMAIEGSFAGKDPIKVELENHDAYWQLSVIDQGKGISPLDIETINTPFNFGKFPEIRKISGIDLIKYVIFLHKGTLSVQSVQGKGSSFIIKFPYY